MQIQFLGTSGHGIALKRNLPAILLDECLLFDCGEGTLKRLKENQVSVNKIKYIFLTHLHADHWMGLPALLWESALYSRDDYSSTKDSPEIFVPEGTKEKVLSLFNLTYSPFDRVNFNVKITELSKNNSSILTIQTETDRYNIEWKETKHQPLCFAFKINNILGISGDTAPSPELASFFSKLDSVIHEATFFDEDGELAHRLNHSTPIDCAEMAGKAGIQRLILTHLPILAEFQELEFLKNAKKKFPNISIAHDLEKLFVG